MKILHCVESYYPSVGGMQEVVKQLSERLAKLGHQVTVATGKHPGRDLKEYNSVRIKEFAIRGNLVNGITGESDKYEKYLIESDFDVIVFFAAQQWATDIALPVLKKIKAVKISVPTGYSGLYLKEYQLYFEQMRNYIHDYDMNVYLSNDYRDINFARINNVRNICVIPNGAGEDEFLKESNIQVRNELKLRKNSFLVLHVGSFTGWKGQNDAMKIFLRSNAENSTLLLIGNEFEEFKKKYKLNLKLLLLKIKAFCKKNKIIIGFYNREFTVAAYKQSNLFLFPSNIECSPIVLFECAAAGLPFLSSDVGNSAEIAEWTKGGCILPTFKNKDGYSFIDLNKSIHVFNDLIKDKNKLKFMSETSFAIWKQNYSWEKIAKQYESLYFKLLMNK